MLIFFSKEDRSYEDDAMLYGKLDNSERNHSLSSSLIALHERRRDGNLDRGPEESDSQV